MRDIDLAAIQEKLRVEGTRASRHSWIVARVRRLLWPFMRSYFFITLEWVRDRLNEAQLGPGGAASPRLAEVITAARAEALAASRTVQELRADLEPLRADMDQATRSTEAAVQRLERTLFHLAARAGMPASDGAEAHSDLGPAVLVDTAFGPMIMKRGDLITEHVQAHGTWDEHILPLIERAARNGDVAVDAGAHFGTLTVAMAKHFRTVHAFEANAGNFNFLCANAALRPAGRIVPHHLALYSSETELSLAAPDLQEVTIEGGPDLQETFSKASNSGGLMFVQGGTGIAAVRAVPLDSLGLERVGFLKIDCQGADGHVVRGALGTIERCRPVIVLEWEAQLAPAHGVSLEEVRAALESRGYRFELLCAHNDKQTDYLAMPSAS
ncbi:FkbM family methyltransferase [Roseomonas alkaliterrae]|uniref:FkbM family methyltransferase n=2 Tax=Neoroseomonas alkaliterrae TaxID=1452450 RepID=A0A840YDD4_9PROT|nr:FkbM family methyltransferase [Neoroseomonas alkaliterrae]MBB5691933.1 FkbM family methyltransferase [Neoroseomonas alkaliterrae]